MGRSRPLGFLAALAITALSLHLPAPSAAQGVEASAAERDPYQAACEYGIATAFAGEMARAESAFVWILGRSPRDPRALVNLGNLSLMRGEHEVALSFYERASASDTTDAGILLNEATAFLLLGDDESARARAGLAMQRAGGAREAARLAGLRVQIEEEAPKAAPRTRVTQDEVLNLLRAAAVGVPSDSLQQKAGSTSGPSAKVGASPKRRVPVWRSAGARAGDPEAASVLYWRR